MNKISLLLLSALASQAVMASPAPTVQAFIGESVEVLDDQGKWQRDVATSSLPRPPVAVLNYNPERDIVQVRLPDGNVWVDHMAVRVTPPLVEDVDFPCESLQNSLAPDQKNNSTMGFGAGCNR